MTLCAVPIAAVLAIVAVVGIASKRDRVDAPDRTWIDAAALAASALVIGLAVRGPATAPAVAGVSRLAQFWHVLMVSAAIILVAIVGRWPTHVRLLGTGLFMVALTIATGLAQPHPIAVALAAGVVGLIGTIAIVDSRPTATQLRSAVRYFAFIAIATLALVAAASLASVSLQKGDTSLIDLSVGLLAVAALVFAGAFPFHAWLPSLTDGEARQGSMMVVGLAQVVGLGAVATLAITMPWPLADSWRPTWTLLASLAGLISAALALGESHPSRAIAYLIGFQGATVAVGLASRSQIGVEGALTILLTLGPTYLLVFAESGPIPVTNGPILRSAGASIGRVSWLVRGIGWLSLLGLPPSLSFWGRGLIVATGFTVFPTETAFAPDTPGLTTGSLTGVVLVWSQVLAVLAVVRHASEVLRVSDATSAPALAHPEGHEPADFSPRTRPDVASVTTANAPSEGDPGAPTLGESAPGIAASLIRIAAAIAIAAGGLAPAPILSAIEQATRGLPLG